MTTRFSLHTLVVVTGSFCIVLAGLVAYWPRGPSLKATVAVKQGMTKAEVVQLLGPPNSGTSEVLTL